MANTRTKGYVYDITQQDVGIPDLYIQVVDIDAVPKEKSLGWGAGQTHERPTG